MTVYKIRERGGSNSFILTEDGRECVLFDCADSRAFSECERLKLTPKAVLLTHGHFDHVGGCREFYEAGVPIYCSEKEANLIFSKEFLGVFGGVYVPKFEPETLSGGLCLTSLHIEVLPTAGHTAGSVCYICGNSLFTGDTLFAGSIGRTDLPSGDMREMSKSLKKLKALEGDYKIYCGHGQDTTLIQEKQYNPYLQ